MKNKPSNVYKLTYSMKHETYFESNIIQLLCMVYLEFKKKNSNIEYVYTK